MTGFEDQLVLPGHMADLGRVVDFIGEACIQANVESDARFDMQLAAEEACANVILHAYNEEGGELMVRFETRDHDAIITVRDRGQAFDPTQVPEPDLDAPLASRPLGGLGLHLMRKLMDEVVFTFSAKEGNTLVMVKRDIVPGEKADVG